ncbi:MAG: hypothetical protein FGM46_04365 [Ferruginibacter sp.]|nr:hypothetical protein [Ferruginibacter sp.]
MSLKSITLFLLISIVLFCHAEVKAQHVNDIVNEGLRLEKIPDEKRALLKFEEALRMDPSLLTALVKCSELHSSIGGRLKDKKKQAVHYSLAVGYAKKAIETYPNAAEACVAMAIAYGKEALIKGGKEKIKLVRKIKDFADQAIQINPNNFKAWHVLGKWYYEMSDLNFLERTGLGLFFEKMPEASFTLSINAFEKANRIDPSVCLNHLELAKSYQKNKQIPMAIASLKKLMSLPAKTEDDPDIKLQAIKLLKSLQ